MSCRSVIGEASTSQAGQFAHCCPSPAPGGAEIMGGNVGKWPGGEASLFGDVALPEKKHWPEPCLFCQSVGCRLVSLNPSKAGWQPSAGATNYFCPTSCWE